MWGLGDPSTGMTAFFFVLGMVRALSRGGAVGFRPAGWTYRSRAPGYGGLGAVAAHIRHSMQASSYLEDAGNFMMAWLGGMPHNTTQP